MEHMDALLPPSPEPVDLDAAYAVDADLLARRGHHLRVNFVSSADGAASLNGVSAGLSSPADKRVFSVLRGLADVVLVGAGTARDEGYGPARPSPQRRERRIAAGMTPAAVIAVVTGSLDLDLASALFTEGEARPVVITSASSDEARRAEVARVADVIVAGDSHVDLGAAVEALVARGLPRVLCEGGPGLFSRVAAAGLVDELCLTVSPLLAGPDLPRISGGPDRWDAARELTLAHVLREDDSLFLRYVCRT